MLTFFLFVKNNPSNFHGNDNLYIQNPQRMILLIMIIWLIAMILQAMLCFLTSVLLYKTCFLLCLMMKINFYNHSYLMV